MIIKQKHVDTGVVLVLILSVIIIAMYSAKVREQERDIEFLQNKIIELKR